MTRLRFLALWRETRRAPTWPPQALAVQQQHRLEGLIAHARANVPYYRELYRSLPFGCTELEALPPVTKSALMANFDNTVADRRISRAEIEAFMAERTPGSQRYLSRYVVCQTSGSTGQPGLFLHDDAALKVYAALLLARTLPAQAGARGLAAFLHAGSRVALVVAPEGYSIEGVLMGMAASRFPHLVTGHVRSLSVMRPLSELVEDLNHLQPAIVAGYATAIEWLAEQQAAGPLHIHPLVVITIAEWISPTSRAHLATSFGCPVRDLYAATEFLGIAAECACGALHVNSDWLILEPVDEAYQRVPLGQPSHTVLLTNLANRVQPLIRYDLGDSITLPGDAYECPCGSPLPVIQVEGRREDILQFQTRKEATEKLVPVLPLALTTIASDVPGVLRFQLIQTALDALSVRVEALPAWDHAETGARMVHQLKAYFAALGLLTVRIVLLPEPPERDPRTGKYRTVRADQTVRARHGAPSKRCLGVPGC